MVLLPGSRGPPALMCEPLSPGKQKQWRAGRALALPTGNEAWQEAAAEDWREEQEPAPRDRAWESSHHEMWSLSQSHTRGRTLLRVESWGLCLQGGLSQDRAGREGRGPPAAWRGVRTRNLLCPEHTFILISPRRVAPKNGTRKDEVTPSTGLSRAGRCHLESSNN